MAPAKMRPYSRGHRLADLGRLAAQLEACVSAVATLEGISDPNYDRVVGRVHRVRNEIEDQARSLQNQLIAQAITRQVEDSLTLEEQAS